MRDYRPQLFQSTATQSQNQKKIRFLYAGEFFDRGNLQRQQRSNTDRAAYGGGGVVGEENDSENGCMLLLRTVMTKGIAVSWKYSVSFKMPFFLANQGYIR